MGIFDKNIHMNGSGTSYQAFLDLADAAAKNDGTIGNRTVRLVKDGDGLATTTFNGIKGDRVSQIANAREAFLTSIAREFGYAARSIAEKALGEGAGREAVPLTARTIRAVNQALGDKGALAAESALVRESKMEFDIAVGFVRTQLEDRMGVTKAELDRGKIQAEALKLIRDGKFPNNKDGLQTAVREVAAPRVALAARLETLLCKHGAPGHLVGRLAATALDEAMAIVDDTKIPDGDAFLDKLDELAQKCLANGHDLFEREGIAEGAVFDANKLVTTIFGPNALAEEDAMKAIDELKTKIEGFKEENMPLEAFRAKCDRALDLTVKTYVMRQLGIEMMLDDSKNTSCGRAGVRLYDAFGIGKGEKDRAIDDYYFWKMKPASMVTRYDLAGKGPEELRSLAARMVFLSIAADCAEKLPKPHGRHPFLNTARTAISNSVADGLAKRFETAVTDEDFAKLAQDFKTQFFQQCDRVDATLKNIDLAENQAKGEVEGRLEEIAGRYGIPLTQGMKDMASRMIAEAKEKLLQNIASVDKALSADECKAAILGRVEEKWLALCRQAAGEIDASSLDPAQKKSFLAKVMENKVDIVHVKIALRTVPGFDAKELADAVKGGNGAKFAEQLFRFIATTNAAITDRAELKSIEGSDDYSAFVATATDLLFVMNPEIGEGVRSLDAASREKLFEDAGNTSTDKSREIQNRNRDGLDLMQSNALALDAKHWSSVISCTMQLQNAIM